MASDLNQRILLAADSLYPGNGGICRVARLMGKILAEGVCDNRWQAKALVYSDREARTDLGIPVNTVAGSRLRFILANNMASFRYTHFLYDFVGMSRAHWHMRTHRRPRLIWIHGIEIWENTRPDRIRSANKADFLISNSAYTRQRAEAAHGGFDRAKVCWLATEEDDIPELPQFNGPPTVLIVARIEEGRYKGHDALIECWPDVIAAVPDARLVIVGRGPGLGNLTKKASQSTASASIEIKGFVADEHMPQIWSDAWVFAMPSLGEGFGLVYIEAMRYGIPVVASIHDAAPEINLDGITGYNVNLDNRSELSDRLIFLLRNPDESKKLGLQGQARWSQNFNFSSFRSRFLPLLNEFLTRH
jgi:phosphatidylinositol alpha-1,6-mannosyltransferase